MKKNRVAVVLNTLINILWVTSLIFIIMSVGAIIASLIYWSSWAIVMSWFNLSAISFFVLLVIIKLRLIIKTVIAKKPFTLENVKRFQAIGFLSLAAGFCYLPIAITNIIKTGVVIIGIGPEGVTMPTVGLALFLFFGLLALVLSEIFCLSYELKEESSLTI